MTDIMFRATSKEAFVKLGRQLGFILPVDPAGPADIRVIFGVDIDFIVKGSLVHKPPVRDNEGVVITPPVVDNANVHVNLRLTHGVALADLLEGTDPDGFDNSSIRVFMRDNGTLANVPSLRRNGVTHSWFRNNLGGGDMVELIWPEPEKRRRIWLGD